MAEDTKANDHLRSVEKMWTEDKKVGGCEGEEDENYQGIPG